METVLQNLGSIPCPDGDRCSKPDCLFKHSWNQKPAAPATAVKHDGPDEDGNPRKRRKLSAEPTQSTVSTTAEPAKPNPEPVTAKKPVSPPPLGRKPTVLAVQSAPSAASATPATPAAATSPQTDSTPKDTAEKKVPIRKAEAPRKIETLNPRMLKGVAPATFEFRFRALTMLHEQFVRLNKEVEKAAGKDAESKKLVLTAQELIWLSLDKEEKLAMENPSVYNMVIKNTIMGYKKMKPEQWKAERLAEIKKEEERKAAATDATSKKQALLGPPKEITTGLTPQEEVAFLPYMLTPIAELAQHGYVPKPPSEEEIKKAREGVEAAMGWETCDRCTKRFQVFPGRREEDGALTTGGPCTYHWGRLIYPERNPNSTSTGQQERTYRCCKQLAGDSTGCTSCSNHVFIVKSPARLATIVPFMETPENPSVPEDRAVCFDCEMCYTVHGLELVRVTAVDWPNGKELLDILVRPMGEILDLNSRFSGVWPEDIANAEVWKPVAPLDPASIPTPSTEPQSGQRKKMKMVPSLSVARDLLFSLISPTTPLIGHGLENDLNAMRICHPTLIDTVLLFPHKKFLPYRYGLKMLMERYLNKAIQVEPDADSSEGAGGGKLLGHDSAEDARAAGELVRYEISKRWARMKREGWKLEKGVFVAPSPGLKIKGAKGVKSEDGKDEKGEKGKLTVEGIESGAEGSMGAIAATESC